MVKEQRGRSRNDEKGKEGAGKETKRSVPHLLKHSVPLASINLSDNKKKTSGCTPPVSCPASLPPLLTLHPVAHVARWGGEPITGDTD